MTKLPLILPSISTAVLPEVVDFWLAARLMLPDIFTSPSTVVPWNRVKRLLPSPTTETEEPESVVLLPTVLVTALKVIGAKKVLPPSMISADLPVPLPVRLMLPRLAMPALLTMLPALVSTAMPIALDVFWLEIDPSLIRKLLELMVT